MSKQPKPNCAVCGKTAKRIEAMRDEEDWECSHVDCPNPNRRKCWSNGTGPAAPCGCGGASRACGYEALSLQ